MEFRDVGFRGGGKTGETREKTIGARREPPNSTNTWHQGGVEPGPHGERRALSPLRQPCSTVEIDLLTGLIQICQTQQFHALSRGLI